MRTDHNTISTRVIFYTLRSLKTSQTILKLCWQVLQTHAQITYFKTFFSTLLIEIVREETGNMKRQIPAHIAYVPYVLTSRLKIFLFTSDIINFLHPLQKCSLSRKFHDSIVCTRHSETEMEGSKLLLSLCGCRHFMVQIQMTMERCFTVAQGPGDHFTNTVFHFSRL